LEQGGGVDRVFLDLFKAFEADVILHRLRDGKVRGAIRPNLYQAKLSVVKNRKSPYIPRKCLKIFI
jgi:hypothetical protein